jgi:hypothetical protein
VSYLGEQLDVVNTFMLAPPAELDMTAMTLAPMLQLLRIQGLAVKNVISKDIRSAVRFMQDHVVGKLIQSQSDNFPNGCDILTAANTWKPWNVT